MRIREITLQEVRMKLVAPFETSMDRTVARRIVLVTPDSRDALPALKQLAMLTGGEPLSGEAVAVDPKVRDANRAAAWKKYSMAASHLGQADLSVGDIWRNGKNTEVHVWSVPPVRNSIEAVRDLLLDAADDLASIATRCQTLIDPLLQTRESLILGGDLVAHPGPLVYKALQLQHCFFGLNRGQLHQESTHQGRKCHER